MAEVASIVPQGTEAPGAGAGEPELPPYMEHSSLWGMGPSNRFRLGAIAVMTNKWFEVRVATPARRVPCCAVV